MLTYQIKDYIREHFGRVGIPTTFLDLYLEAGRLLIEQQGNFWWMTSTTPALFDTTIDDGDYVIAASGGDITIPKFKDLRALHYKVSTAVSWIKISVGPDTKDELDLMYDDGSNGAPERATLENMTLYIYPQDPQLAYNMRVYYYGYTDMPANTAEDTLTREFPMALIYAALQQGYEMELKDMQGAAYWKALLGGNPFGSAGEIARIKRENFKRAWHDQIDLVPKVGPGSQHRRLDNLKIYMR